MFRSVLAGILMLAVAESLLVVAGGLPWRHALIAGLAALPAIGVALLFFRHDRLAPFYRRVWELKGIARFRRQETRSAWRKFKGLFVDEERPEKLLEDVERRLQRYTGTACKTDLTELTEES